MPTPSSVRSATAELLLARLADEQVEARLPSVMAGLVRDGALVWADGRGEVEGRAPDGDTQYRMGSITKPFVAVAVLRLRDEGRLALTDRLDTHLPGTPVGGATIAQLLSHASGLQAETDGPWWERAPGGSWSQLAESLGPAAARHRPGRRFHYSNVGYGVLGQLVATFRGAAWEQVVHDEILAPLGMARTTTRPVPPAATGYAVHPFADVVLPEPEHDAGAMAPAGQLWSTVEDLARFAAFLAGDGGDVLAGDTLAEMREPLALDDRPGEAWTTAYGLGLQIWNTAGRRAVGHGGSMPGFLALLRVDLDTRDAAVVATNTTAGLRGQLPLDLLELLHTHEPPPRATWAPAAVPATALELTGHWYWGPTPLRVTVPHDADLALAPVPGVAGRASRFRAEADGTYTGLDGYYAGETLRVVRHADGRLSHLDLASFVLTRRPYDPEADVPGGVDTGGWRPLTLSDEQEHP